MKRSEFVDKLQDMLIQLGFVCYSDCGCCCDEPSSEQARLLLNRIESIGMLPPLNEQNYHYMDNQSRLDENSIKWYHSWEDEE